MSQQPKTAVELMGRGPVVPVVILERAVDAVPLARALLAGGVSTIEITLRTAAGLEAIAAVSAEVPQMAVGAGTVVRAEQVSDVIAAGASFLVSPGSTPALLDAFAAQSVPVLPGVATASEAMALAERGITEMKFFPAGAIGGTKALKGLASPLPHITFCPTGGIDASVARDYLSLPNVACVGGSWLTPENLIADQDWDAITALAVEAAALR